MSAVFFVSASPAKLVGDFGQRRSCADSAGFASAPLDRCALLLEDRDQLRIAIRQRLARGRLVIVQDDALGIEGDRSRRLAL